MLKNFLMLISTFLFVLNSASYAEVAYKIQEQTETRTGTAYRGEYTLDVIYPVVKDLANKEAQELINKTIKEYVPSEDSLFEMGYEITYTSEKYLSILLKPYERNDFEGAAHGMPGLVGLVFDLETGKQLYINDLFRSDSDYKDYIDRIVKNRIDEIDFYFKADFTGIKHDENFYITDKHLVLCYPPYLYTCFAESPLRIKIPLLDLRPMLKVELGDEK